MSSSSRVVVVAGCHCGSSSRVVVVAGRRRRGLSSCVVVAGCRCALSLRVVVAGCRRCVSDLLIFTATLSAIRRHRAAARSRRMPTGPRSLADARPRAPAFRQRRRPSHWRRPSRRRRPVLPRPRCTQHTSIARLWHQRMMSCFASRSDTLSTWGYNCRRHAGVSCAREKRGSMVINTGDNQ